MLDRPGRETADYLAVDGAPSTASAVQRVAGEEVAVGRAEQARADLARPAAARLHFEPGASREQPVAARILGVGAVEGEGVVAVELGAAGERDPGKAELEQVADRQGAAQAAGKVAIAIAVATTAETVDSASTLEADRSGEASAVRAQTERSARPDKPERACLERRRMAGRVIETVDGDHPADRLAAPQRGLRPAHDLDPRRDIGVEQLEPREVPCRRIVGADAVDEQQGVGVLGASDPDLGQQARRALRGDRDRRRQAQQGRDQRLPEADDRRPVDDGDAGRHLVFGRRHPRGGDGDRFGGDWQCEHGGPPLTTIRRHGGTRCLAQPAHAPRLVPAEETDDRSRQVPDLAGQFRLHSCGHSAGFSPASLSTAPGWTAPVGGTSIDSANARSPAGCQIGSFGVIGGP